jgi:hypothetical protein
MKATGKYVLTLMAVVALTAALGLAKSGEKTASKSASIDITAATATPDGLLQPGTYKMTLFGDPAAPQVAFYKGNKLVCKCPVKIETLPAKADYTQLLVEKGANGTRILKTVSIGGWTEKVVFSEASAAGAGR